MLASANDLAESAASIGLDNNAYKTSIRDLRQRGQVATNSTPAPVDDEGDGPAELDAKGRAILRRDIRALAERISRHDPEAEIAFLMRRYAAWQEFNVLSWADSDGRLQQYPTAASVADEFRAIAERPSYNALMRLEDRLFNGPDWFEGQRLASRMALALGYIGAAQAIHDQVAKRLADLPGLATLRYANDTPYVDPAIANWAKSAPGNNAPSQGGEVVDAPEAGEPDLRDSIAALEADIASRRSRRARAVAKLALAKELASAGLSSHARFLLQELSETLSEPLLAAWDSELADEIRSAQGRVS